MTILLKTTVLSLVADTRLEGLVLENRRLRIRNREAAVRLEGEYRVVRRLRRRMESQVSLIQRLRRDNGSRGPVRRESAARNGVCGFCYEALAEARRLDCGCGRFAYCSRICKNLHWYRRHRAYCDGPRSIYPEPPYDQGE